MVAKRQQTRQTQTVLFDVDSATLDPVNRGWMETRLAIDRALFEAAGGGGTAEGYASPEATEDHNQKLSEMRAQAVVQATKDALGQALVVPLTPTGKGEGRAIKAGLLNPPDPPTSPAQWPSAKQKQLAVEQRTSWPSWRKVDLTVNGLLVVRVMGRGARRD
jgi:hypothetical protein